MIYVFNKNKMVSYMVAFFIVIALFTFSTTVIPDRNIQIIKVSTNAISNNVINNILNNY